MAAKLTDRSTKLLLAILQDDVDAFQATLNGASLDEVSNIQDSSTSKVSGARPIGEILKATPPI